MTELRLQTDAGCTDDFDPKSMPADVALNRIKSAITPVKTHEIVLIRQALGRVLAEDIHSTMDVPAAANSAMDGYAVNAASIPADGTTELRVIGTSWAGKPCKQALQRGTCVRIMTGGLIPEGADTVVAQENAQRNEDSIVIDARTRKGENVRPAGEDITCGDLILQSGTPLYPAELGLIASLGIAEVTVYRRIRVAFFSTGDELRSIGEPLEEGQIYDSNRYTLYGMLTRLGAEVIDLGVVRDTPEAIESAFQSAAEKADVIITTGGVSVGEADFVRECLDRIGRIDFWKVAMKPGRPLAFGQVHDTWFFGLPGNPVSVMVTFYRFVQPALRKLMGDETFEPLTVKVICTSNLKKRPGRMEFQRGVLQRNSTGELTVCKTGDQGSGILSSMSQANCFIILPTESDGVVAGEAAEVQPFFGLV